jgi:hypothetical protein
MLSELVPISTLILDPANARKHSKKNLEAIKGSLARFGQQKPIVVSKDNIVIAGNGTLEAAKALKWTDIEIKRSQLMGSDITAYAIADNRAGELAEWDLDVLPDVLKSLSEEFDLGEIGFDSNDLAKLIKEVKAGETADDAIPEEVEPRCKSGDLWILGEHRLICGDSSDPLVLERLMAGEKAELVFTDPPYRMQVEGGSNQKVGKSAKKLGEAIAHLCDFDPIAFLNSLSLVFDKKKMNAYIFCNKDLVPDYLKWGVDAGYSFNILFWKKPTAIPLGGSHRPDVEYLLLFRQGGVWNNGLAGVNYSKCLEFGREASKDHPTLKPVDLIVNECLISSNRKGIVVDFFLGSGSTMVACEKIERRCYGVEIEPKYCDVILTRWEKFTGKQAKLDITGHRG